MILKKERSNSFNRITLLVTWIWSAALIINGCQNAPVGSLDRAKAALDSAAASGAPKYARDIYQRADSVLQLGRLEMSHQNGHLPFFRKYATAESLFTRAEALAFQANRNAQASRLALAHRARAEWTELNRLLESYRQALDGSLVIYKAERLWANAQMDLQICEQLMAEEDYASAIEMAAEVRKGMDRLAGILAEYGNDEVQQIGRWRSWVQETLSASRRSKTYAIIVDKTARKTYLVHKGTLIYTYRCELGWNSARQKMFAGDGATPEGKYKVVAIKATGSKYYKALLLDYPNHDDRQRFRQNKAKGIISFNARIGANIEIHGYGGQNQDWTDGCVALENANMDHLMKYVAMGTPVTIVRKSDQWP